MRRLGRNLQKLRLNVGRKLIEVGLKKQSACESRNALGPADHKIGLPERLQNLALSGFQVREVESSARFQEAKRSSEKLLERERDLVTRGSFLQVRIQPAPVCRPIGWIGRDDVKPAYGVESRNTFEIVRA